MTRKLETTHLPAWSPALAGAVLLWSACAGTAASSGPQPACPTIAPGRIADTPPIPKSPIEPVLSQAERNELGGYGARATVQALVDSTGHVVRCTVRVLPGSDPRLGNAARGAVIAAVFTPATINGAPTQAWIQQPFAVGIR